LLTSSAKGLSLVHSRLQSLGHVRKGASLLWIKHAALAAQKAGARFSR
jgi:hypothetical protein